MKLNSLQGDDLAENFGFLIREAHCTAFFVEAEKKAEQYAALFYSCTETIKYAYLNLQ